MISQNKINKIKAIILDIDGVLTDGKIGYSDGPEEIKFFHEKADHLHIFAHSQGTPITFETIFQQLDDEYRQKIKSYITIGSILSYYYHTALILGNNYPPTRFRVQKYGPLHDGFKWVNCWNLLDPITEFYGLDEFVNKDTCSPINIKTRARFHSDYWVNIFEVHSPFCNHILDITTEDFWSDQKQIPKNCFSDNEYKRNIRLVGLFSGIVTLIALVLTHKFWHFNILDYAFDIFTFISNSLEETNIFKVAIENLKSSNLFHSIIESTKYLRKNVSAILDFTLLGYLGLQIFKAISLNIKYKK